ncbi:MAG: hypothetical protein ACRDK3_05930 [Actinomycetota bacterium]
MATSAKVIVGVCLVVALFVGLSGTFDYARETSRRSAARSMSEESLLPQSGQTERRRTAPSVKLRGSRDLVAQLNQIGFKQAIVLTRAQPRRLVLGFTGEQDVSARTSYEVGGRTVTVGQIYGVPLPSAGGLVRLDSRRAAVEVGGVLYWSERGYTLTIAAESQDLVRRLRWRFPAP